MALGIWEQKAQYQPKLAICIPNTGLVTTEWATGFRMMQIPLPFTVFGNRGLPIDRARDELAIRYKNLLVEQAIDSQVNYLFFLDSDVICPPETLALLLAWQVPVVSGLYRSKNGHLAYWRQMKKAGEGRYSSFDINWLSQEAQRLGTTLLSHSDTVIPAGCMLIDMRVFQQIKKPYFVWTQGREDGGVSEDFYFCEKLREAGIPIHIDLRIQTYHIDWIKWKCDGTFERLMM